MTQVEIDSAPTPKRQRIAKVIARAGLCSRRDAEAWIVNGRVSVNGALLTSPAVDVAPDDAIVVDGVPLPSIEKTRLFLFHKPRGIVTSDRDPEGRETVADYLRAHWPDVPRVVTIGRLDINTEGLLLLTNDGGLARILELPQTAWVRRYRVRAKGTADVAALEALAAGVTIDGMNYVGIEAKLDRTQGANCWLTMGLREGKNREIKRVLEHLGLEVNRLIRLSFGPFQLLALPEGAVEEVRTRVLRDQLGENLARQAGVDLGEMETVTPSPSHRLSPGERWGRDTPEPSRRTSADKRGGARAPPRRPEPARTDRDTAPERHRPVARTRKHVSRLRAADHATTQTGPRKRVERSDTRDHRERTIVVERLVATRGGSQPETKPDKRRPRRPEAHTSEVRRDRNGRMRTRDSNPPAKNRNPSSRASRETGSDRLQADRGNVKRHVSERGHESPSAKGKRVRVARSGARARVDKDVQPRRSGRTERPKDDNASRRTPRDRTPPGRTSPGRTWSKEAPNSETSGEPREKRPASKKEKTRRSDTATARSRAQDRAGFHRDRRGSRDKPRPPSKPPR